MIHLTKTIKGIDWNIRSTEVQLIDVLLNHVCQVIQVM